MRALVYKGERHLTVEEMDTPRPGPGEAVIEVERSGVCGSDLYIYEGRRKVNLPRILGHEFVGVIREMGDSKVSAFRVVERVVAEPVIGCGLCLACRRGQYNVCQTRVILGAETNGVFAEQVKVPLTNLFKVPDGVPPDEAALVQPVAVVVHTLRRTNLQAGERVAVLGAGPIGALIALTARASGATEVVLTEPNPFRRKLMQNMGYTVFDTGREEVPLPVVPEAAEESGFDAVFDAAGGPNTLSQAIRMTRIQGRVVLVANYREEPAFDSAFARRREINFITTRAHTFEDFRSALALIATRQVDVRPLITREVGLEELPEVFETLSTHGPLMKVLGRA
jgi:2-desacetyl-2-hydroxyethyl bacteriochlorophyllide A dehydrogenase